MSRKSCYRYKYSSFCVVTCSKAVFQCLDVLLKLNHSLVEPHLDVIWKMLWRTECSAGDAHNSLMNSLISTYVKLRQVQHILCTVHLSLTEAILVDILGNCISEPYLFSPQVFPHKEHSEPSFSSPVGKSGALLTI